MQQEGAQITGGRPGSCAVFSPCSNMCGGLEVSESNLQRGGSQGAAVERLDRVTDRARCVERRAASPAD